MTRPPPISLTIVTDGHTDHGLTFLAADGRGQVAHGRTVVPAAQWPRWQWPQPPGGAGVAGWLTEGQAVAQALVPAAVWQFLARQREGSVLMLQLPTALLGIPWEWALSEATGGQPLDERFVVQRHLVDTSAPDAAPRHPPPADALAALAVGADALTADWPAHWPLVQATAADWPSQAGDAALLLLGAAAAAACDPAQLLAVAARPLAPRLLLAELAEPPARLAAAAAAAGLALLALPPGGAAAWLPVFWRALSSGASLAQAAQAARAAARLAATAPGAPALAMAGAQAWFHGDGQHVPLRAAAPRQPDDDVRQVTILSCDLVDSTRLMGRLGDEEYSERLTQYHRRVAQTVGAHGGVSDDPQGDDGFMCYFGFPVANEDSAAQALRAGLGLANALADLEWQLRIGISTGRVVIRNGQPVGAAVHHAARLQARALPGTVLVGDTTRALAAERFDFDTLALSAPLKGFDDSGAIHQVLRERPAAGTERFDSRAQLSRFVGREAELAQLRGLWKAACGGQRQALLVAGEAGIGKSRLVREFRRVLVDAGQRALECRCAPELSGSPFQPLIDLLQRQLDWHAHPDPAARLQRLRSQVPRDMHDDESLALLGGLLGLPRAVLPAATERSPERSRQRTMALLLRWLQALVERGPVCLIVEDVHWVDPSTREFLGRVTAGQPQARLLLLLTARGRADPALAQALGLPVLALGGLPVEVACQLLLGAFGDAALAGDQLRWLAERSDGVPLFIEESARMAAALAARQAGGDLAHTLREAVPATLQDLLLARLDQLAQAKHAAQLGSAIGRSFSHALIAAVNAHPDSPIRLPDLDAELAALQEAGLVHGQLGGEQRLYVFKHALVRDAAHQTLLERDRRRLHGCIATVLQAQFAALCEQQPERVAQHLEWAGQDEQALAAWERAARHAAQRSAHDEAIAHLQRAMGLVVRQPEGAPRDRQELRLQLLLASRLIATAGYGADQVEAVYQRALALGQALGDEGSRTKARLGLEGWHFMRGNFAQAHAIAREVAASLGERPEPLAQIQSTWALANITFHQGQARQAVALMDLALAQYESLGHRAGAVQDPGVMCLCYSSWALWELGQADQSLQRARRVVDLAEGLNHPFSIGEAHGFLAVAHHFRGETAPALKAARRAIEVCEAGGFAVWLAHAKVIHGRLVAETGDLDAGLEEMRQGDAMWAATGAVVTRPFYTVMRAEGLALAGRFDEGLALLHEAYALIQRCGERYYEPEVRRWIGVLIWRRGGDAGLAEAQPWLESALASARSLGLAGLALRAATSLARLWAAQGRPGDAAALLGGELRGLTEGRGTRDVREAQALLAGWPAASA